MVKVKEDEYSKVFVDSTSKIRIVTTYEINGEKVSKKEWEKHELANRKSV